MRACCRTPIYNRDGKFVGWKQNRLVGTLPCRVFLGLVASKHPQAQSLSLHVLNVLMNGIFASCAGLNMACRPLLPPFLQ